MIVHLIRSDLEFILQQTIIAERHAAGENLLSPLSNSLMPFGLRMIDGTSPFVDQNQTYNSTPSHQVFLRAYEMRDGVPVNTGKLIVNRDLGPDGEFGTADDVVLGGMSTWGMSTWGMSTWGVSTWGVSTWGMSTWG